MARTFLVEVKPYNNVTNQRVTVRLSKAGTHGVVIAGSDYQWHPLVTQIPTISYLLQSRNGVGGFDTGYGSLGLTYPRGHQLDDGTLFEALKTYDWDGAECKVWMGDNDADFSTFTQILEGRCGPLSSEGLEAKIIFRGPAADLDKDLLSKSYDGSGGAEGRADIKGNLKPWCSGVALNITPKLLDPLTQVYQYHGYGPTQGVTAVYENAVQLKPVTTVVATHAQLVALTLAEDEWAAAPAVGMFRLGGEPVGLITADVVGATDGASTPKRAGAVCAHLMKSQAGIASGKLASATALDTAFPYDLAGFYVTQQVTVADAVKQILEGINGYVIPDGQANWIFGRNQNGKTPTPIDNSRSTLPLVRPNTLKQLDGPTRAYKVRVGGDRNWTPQSNISDAVREALTDAQAASTAAAQAIQDAQDVLDLVTEIGEDGKLVGDEKKQLFRQLSEWSSEKSSLEAQANDLGIATEKDTYNTKFNALNTYFNGLTPPLINYGEPTTIDRAVLIQKITEFTNSRTALLVRISRRATEVGNAEIYDPMVYATAADFNAFWGAAPNTQIVTTTTIGGRAIQVGDNSGNDGTSIAPNQWLNYHSEDLYEVKFELEIVAANASAKMYLGIEAQDNAGQNLGSTYNYVALNNGTMTASLGRKTYTGYFRGLTGSAASGTSSDRANPTSLPTGTVRIRPRLLLGQPSTSHRTIIHSVQLRKIEDATLAFTGAWSSSRSYFINEAVTYSGRTFSSKSNGNQNNVPPSAATSNTHWTLVADRGEDGTPGLDGTPGEDGAPGYRTMLVPLYKRAATAPALPTAVTYWKFALSPPTLQGNLNGWSLTQPSSNGQPLWTTSATTSCLATEDTGTIDPSAWVAPTLLVQDGAQGPEGPRGPAGTAGTAAVTAILKPEGMALPSYANGLAADFAGAATTMQLLVDTSDVSSSFTLSVVSNPQALTTSISGRTVTITGAGSSAGQFGNANVNTASITIRATGTGTYAGRNFDKVFTLTKQKGGYEIVSSLPSTNLFAGRVVFLTTDEKLYTYSGSAWVATVNTTSTIPGAQIVGTVPNVQVPASVVTGTLTNSQIASLDAAKLLGTVSNTQIASVDTSKLTGTINTAQIANGALDATKFASAVKPVEIVSSLPTTGLTSGRIVYLSSDGKLYRYHGTQWVSAVPATDITGTIANNQIASVDTSKLTGTIVNNQIASIDTSKLTGSITNNQIASIDTTKLTGQITNTQIASVATSKLSGTISNSQIADIAATKLTGQITGTQITDNAISSPKIAAGAITAGKIAAGAVTADEIAANTITGDKLVTNSITSREIAANTITAGQIAANTITAGQIATNAITADELAAGAVTANHIVANTITGDKLLTNSITSREIATNTITATQIAAGTITAAEIKANTITGDKLVTNSITSREIAADTITASQIAANAITASELASNSVQATHITSNAVTADKVAANAITAGKIAAGAISATEIASNSISANKLILTPSGQSINADPAIQDLTLWQGNTTLFTENGWIGGKAFISSTSTYTFTELVPIDLSKTYRASIEARSSSGGNRRMYGTVVFYDKDKNVISGSGNGAGWPSAGSYHYFGIVNGTPPVSATRYSITFGVGQAAGFPSGAHYMALGALYGRDGSTGSNVVGSMLIQEVIPAELIVDGTITGNKLVANTIGAREIAANSITATQIAANTITALEIGANAITASELAANAVTATHILANTITGDKLITNSITSREIATNAVTATQIASNTITANEIAANAITASELAANSVSAGHIVANSITASQIAAGAITASELATNAVTADKIAAGQVTAAKINVTSLSSISATIGLLRTATSGQRTEIDNNGMRVYNSSNVMLVRLGTW